MTFAFCVFLVRAALSALNNESPLIRCAGHSAEISLHGIPQTFSVYVLKKISYRRLPNLFTTQSSKLRSGLIGRTWALRKLLTIRAEFHSPSLRSASAG